jgi:hypothetical protein
MLSYQIDVNASERTLFEDCHLTGASVIQRWYYRALPIQTTYVPVRVHIRKPIISPERATLSGGIRKRHLSNS